MVGHPPRKIQFIRPCKWGEYQGYKKRGPTWIKNHVKLLDNPKYTNLTLNQRAILHGLWLLTARTGKALPLDTRFIGAQLGADCRATGVALKALLDNDFIELCSESVAMVATECEQTVAQRAETETETDKPHAPNGASPPSKRIVGNRIPDDWMPSPTDIEFARSKGMTDGQITEFADEFRDYWAAQTGRNSCKRGERGWSLTWKNRVRDLAEHGRIGNRAIAERGQPLRNQREPASFARAAARVVAKTQGRQGKLGDGDI